MNRFFSKRPSAAERVKRVKRSHQQGAAMMIALAATLLVSALAGASLARQSRLIASEEAAREESQARPILVAAIDWASVILREDAKKERIAHLGQSWAHPIDNVSVEDFLAEPMDTNASQKSSKLSIRIVDEQSKFNVLSMRPGEVSAPGRLAALKKLGALAPSPEADWALAYALSVFGQGQANSSPPATRLSPAWPPTISAALFLPKDDPADSPVGAPHAQGETNSQTLSFLPEATLVNVNTAPPSVLAAMVPSLTLSSATALVAERSKRPFPSVAAFLAELPMDPRQPASPGDAGALLSVESSYFLVEARLATDRGDKRATALIARQGLSTRALWIRFD